MDIISFYTVDESARVYIANTKKLVNDAFKIHKTTPVVTAAFGRTLTAATIMGSMMKNETDLLTITIKGDGPLGGIVTTANNGAEVKGYVYNNYVDIPLKPNGKLDVSKAVGSGTISITKDIGLKTPISGMVPLTTSEIAEDITYYYAKSEQIPTAVSLGVLVDIDYTVKEAGGFIIELLPNAKEIFINNLENTIKNLPSITNMLLNKDDIIKMLFENNSVIKHGEIEPKFYCNCNREKTEKALIAIGKKELNEILVEDKKAIMHCYFCKKDYVFNDEDLKSLIFQI
ncbi:MAG: Hsp33 family molecular chaperone HslO [Defluviitaleaceae bacterium]|nr:Hsp33 family molecular chaperone HslO [Defluviitaleaceae bacterium]